MREVITKLRFPDDTADAVSGIVVAVFEGLNDDGRLLVRWGPGQGAIRLARTIWMENAPDWSLCKGLRVVLGFEEGNQAEPIVLGLLDQPPETVQDPDKGRSATEDKPKVLRIESEQELILECGKAKIALRADGRVVILGGYLLSRSKGVNKIKGGSVQIN